MKRPRRKTQRRQNRKRSARQGRAAKRVARRPSFAHAVAVPQSLPPDTPELAKLLADAQTELRSARRSIWSLGLLYRHLKKDKLAEAGHFASAEQWWEARLGTQLDPGTVGRYAQLTRAVSQQATLDFKTECLVLYLRWCRKTRHEIVKDPGEEIIPIIQDRKIVKKRFADCTENEMKSALHALAFKKDPGMSLPPQLAKFVSYADSNLGAAGDDEVHKLEGYMLGKEPRVRMDFSVYDLVEALQSLLKSTQGFPLFSEQHPDDGLDS
jgi:hypothetical protein